MIVSMLNDDVQIEAMSCLQILSSWSDKKWIRRLDSALAEFIFEQDSGETSDALLVGAAMLAYFEGHGHTCLPLRPLISSPDALLGWPEDRQHELNSLWSRLPSAMAEWVEQILMSTCVQSLIDASMPDVTAPTDQSVASRPLVLAGTHDEPVLYLRRYWNHEQFVFQEIVRRVGEARNVDELRAATILSRLFDSGRAEDDLSEASRFDWQKFACAVALRSSFTVITGGPGTGKTYTAARLLATLFAVDSAPDRLKIALAAPTGKAAARLRQSIDKALEELVQQVGDGLDLTELARRIGAAKTLHALLGASSDSRQFRYNASNQLDLDVLIVDEASMIHLEMMSALLQALPPSTRLILLGDKDQLDSVEAGAVMGDLTREAIKGSYSAQTARYAWAVTQQRIPDSFCAMGSGSPLLAQQIVMLRESRRFGASIGQLALSVNSGQCEMAVDLLERDSLQTVLALAGSTISDVLDLGVRGRPGAKPCFADYLNEIKQWNAFKDKNPDTHQAWIKRVLNAFDQFRVLCAVNQGDWGTVAINYSMLNALEQAGLMNTGKSGKEWFAGRPIMVTRNDPDLGVYNGDVGVVLPSLRRVEGDKGAFALRAYFLDGDQLRSVSVSRLAHVETAFAMTVHKSQGSEYRHVALVLPPGRNEHLSRELIYTGITRAREYLTIFEGQAGSFKQAVARASGRTSGLGSALGSA